MAKAHTNHGWKHRPKGASGVPGTRRGLGRRQGRHGIAQALSADNQPSADAKMARQDRAATARISPRRSRWKMGEVDDPKMRVRRHPGTRVDARTNWMSARREGGAGVEGPPAQTDGRRSELEAPDAETWTQQHKPR